MSHLHSHTHCICCGLVAVVTTEEKGDKLVAYLVEQHAVECAFAHLHDERRELARWLNPRKCDHPAPVRVSELSDSKWANTRCPKCRFSAYGRAAASLSDREILFSAQHREVTELPPKPEDCYHVAIEVTSLERAFNDIQCKVCGHIERFVPIDFPELLRLAPERGRREQIRALFLKAMKERS